MIRSHVRSLRSAGLVLAALVIGCGGDGPSAPPASPASITILTPASTLTAIGATLQLSVTALNTASLPTWTSSNPGVASVNGAGLATAVANGTTVMTASVPGASATVSITVDAGPTSAEIAAIIGAAGKLLPGPVVKDSTRSGAPAVFEDGDSRYTPWLHSESKNVTDVLNLGINDNIIWPGQLIYGTGVSTFNYDDIQVERGPITISLNLEATPGSDNLSKTIADPKLSTLRGGISELLTGVTAVPAAASFSMETVHSVAQLNLALSGNASGGAYDIAAQYDFASTEKRTKIVVKYTQVYFSVDIDQPLSAGAFVKTGTPLADVQAAFPAGSRPMYVAGVKYGWMAVMVIESSQSVQATRTALQAAYNGVVASGSASLSIADSLLLENANIEAYVYGGSTAALPNIANGLAGFKTIMAASANFSASSIGVPLLYTFRNMSDNTLAAVNLAANYTVNVPVRIRERIRVAVTRYFMEMADDEGTDNAVEIDRLFVYANPFNKATDLASMIYPAGRQQVHGYSSGGDGWVSNSGGVFSLSLSGAYLDFVFDTDPEQGFSLETAKIDFSAYARDYDASSANEEGGGSRTILGANFFENSGLHDFRITSSDFTILVTVRITRTP